LGRPDHIPEMIVGDSRRRMLDGYYKLFPAIMDCDAPVIAAVNGTAAGMGAHLAFVCDLVIAAEESKFIEVFARRGLIPDALGTYLLPRLVGPQKAKELMFFGDDLPATEAERIGLVNKVVPRAELAATAGEWADRLAAGPSRSFALTKWLVNQSLETSRDQAMQNEAWAVEINGNTEDAKEGVASFLERRDPVWKGY
jgi:2-(1,2-epoxy-1,2-dihydrophenyl)acetyl-CoA isomerase